MITELVEELDAVRYTNDLVDLAEVPDQIDEVATRLLAEAREQFDLSPVVEQFGTWAVTSYGMECLQNYYPIEKKRLLERRADQPTLEQHMAHKHWVNMADFLDCLHAARLHHFGGRRVPRVRRSVPKDPAQVAPRPPRAISLRLRFQVLKRDGYRCRICGKGRDDGAVLEIDHVHPVSKGGKSSEGNLQTLCRACNQGKRTDEL